MTLRLFYRVAVRCFLFTIALLTALNVAGAVIGLERLRMYMDSLPFLMRLPLGVLGAFSAFGIFALWIGMTLDCLSSKLPGWSKFKWVLLLLITNMLGALIYYFRVFNRQSPAPQ